MTTLARTIAEVGQADGAAMDTARKQWNGLAKPVGGLGMLEDLVVQLAGIVGTANVTLDKRTLIVACADNGVVRHGVSASDASVTRIMAHAIGAGQSTVCQMARHANCEVLTVDVGMLEGPHIPNVRTQPIRPGGTGDITRGPAMTRDECVRAIELGIDLVRERKETGASIVLTGEMGIGNTTTSCAVACALFGRSPVELVGPGTGLSAEGIAHKVAIIESALETNQPDSSDAIDVLMKVGGFDLATICGICLGGARYRVPVLLDGIITLAAAACAVRLCPACRFVLFGSHVSAEPVARLLLDALELDAPIHAGMHLGEGTGAVAALGLLDVALEAYHRTSTLDQLDIDGYQPEAQS